MLEQLIYGIQMETLPTFIVDIILIDSLNAPLKVGKLL